MKLSFNFILFLILSGFTLSSAPKVAIAAPHPVRDYCEKLLRGLSEDIRDHEVNLYSFDSKQLAKYYATLESENNSEEASKVIALLIFKNRANLHLSRTESLVLSYIIKGYELFDLDYYSRHRHILSLRAQIEVARRMIFYSIKDFLWSFGPFALRVFSEFYVSTEKSHLLVRLRDKILKNPDAQNILQLNTKTDFFNATFSQSLQNIDHLSNTLKRAHKYNFLAPLSWNYVVAFASMIASTAFGSPIDLNPVLHITDNVRPIYMQSNFLADIQNSEQFQLASKSISYIHEKNMIEDAITQGAPQLSSNNISLEETNLCDIAAMAQQA